MGKSVLLLCVRQLTDCVFLSRNFGIKDKVAQRHEDRNEKNNKIKLDFIIVYLKVIVYCKVIR